MQERCFILATIEQNWLSTCEMSKCLKCNAMQKCEMQSCKMQKNIKLQILLNVKISIVKLSKVKHNIALKKHTHLRVIYILIR